MLLMTPITRRGMLAGSASLVAAPLLLAQPKTTPSEPFPYCLNTSTIRVAESQWGKPRPIIESIKIAAKAGYHAIEPWISELDDYVKTGGTLKDLGKQIRDAGLAVPDAIGFAEWLVDDDARRKKGLEQAKQDMDKVQQIGGLRLAAPPVGATGGMSRRDDPKHTNPVSDLLIAAERYAALLELGRKMNVTPIVEVWGFSKTLSRLGETLLVAAECGLPGGAILPDVYHLYKGGSLFNGLKLLGPESIGIFHVNDYPDIARGKIADQDRVFPGDGVAPLKVILSTLHKVGYRGYLSLELFNRDYWKRDALGVATEGLEKLRRQVTDALKA
jgi:2-keto-myo-inositol isomerase